MKPPYCTFHHKSIMTLYFFFLLFVLVKYFGLGFFVSNQYWESLYGWTFLIRGINFIIFLLFSTYSSWILVSPNTFKDMRFKILTCSLISSLKTLKKQLKFWYSYRPFNLIGYVLKLSLYIATIDLCLIVVRYFVDYHRKYGQI